MSDANGFPLAVVDALTLPGSYRKALRPGEIVKDAAGRERQLPRYFYEVPSWNTAMHIKLTTDFLLWEFIQVDVRETQLLLNFPRYVPCAITLLAVCLQRFRDAVGTLVHISANGGYRSPSHALSRNASLHGWGVAANIYKIGDSYLDDRESIERFSAIAHSTLPGIWTRPYGRPAGFAEDHLHLDLGYVTSIPRDVRANE